MMTPMIDVIFLLLVFFLTTSSFQLVELALPSSISETKAAAGSSDQPPPVPDQDAIEQIVIKLTFENGQPAATLNGSRLPNLAELPERLRAISQIRADVPVIIDPNGDVPAALVVTAYDGARQVGLSRVFLATRVSE